MLFMIPTVVAVAMGGWFVVATDEDWKWKALVGGVVFVSLALQWVPALQTHFLVPLLMQCGVGIGLLIYLKAGYM